MKFESFKIYMLFQLFQLFFQKWPFFQLFQLEWPPCKHTMHFLSDLPDIVKDMKIMKTNYFEFLKFHLSQMAKNAPKLSTMVGENFVIRFSQKAKNALINAFLNFRNAFFMKFPEFSTFS